MARPSLNALTHRVVEYFRKHAARYGLDPKRVEARYILNWGGFVNASFHLTDGNTSYHLKLADDEESQEQLEHWQVFSQRLTEMYHAPRLLDWVAIPRTPFAGLLCEYIPGRPVDYAARPDLLKAVLSVLERLHNDRELAAALTAELASIDEEVPTCTSYFISVYIDRFDSDLIGIANDLPPFVPLSLLDWMQGETRELEGLARDLPAFQHPANAPTHGDLWPSNILVPEDDGDNVTGDGVTSDGVTSDGSSLTIIDWDDLALGDPALEYSIVLGPLWRSSVLTQAEIETMLPQDADFRSRFNLCLRALLLDEVIDSLADWVESGFAPDLQAEVRPAKERIHREGLERYHSLYAES